MKKNISEKIVISKPDLNKARKRIAKAETIKESFVIPENIKNFGINKKYHIRTYGCQSNVRDSENMKGMLEAINYTWEEDILKADLVILNTCAIRENAEKKVFGEIGFLKQLKISNPNFIFGLAGCMPQEEKVVEKILKSTNHIDFLMGTHNIYRLLVILEQAIFEKQTVVEIWSKEGDIIENMPSIRNHKIKAFVNVMHGCDHFCTYCIVPFTRGKIRSRDKDDILKEIWELIDEGYKEVTLLGQNVNDYGNDLKDQNYRFKDLLIDVAKTKIERVRFTTSNPWNFNDELIDAISEYKNIMPFFHLPIQSGDEVILKKMNRHMEISDYINKIEKIRKQIPSVAISTDLIVGFPGETDEQFQKTLDLYNLIQFDNAYTFIFSPREGTIAEKMDDNTPIEVKEKRLQKLNDLVKKYARKNNETYVGKTYKVLVEGLSKKNHEMTTGYSPEWKVVNFKAKDTTKPGDIVNVQIDEALGFSLIGTEK